MDKNHTPTIREPIPLRRYFTAWWILCVGLLIAIALFAIVRNWEMKNRRIAFESHARAHANAVINNLSAYLGALQFVGDYIDNSVLVTREEFSGFVKSALLRYPGIQAFSWNPLIADSAREAFELQVRGEGFKEFKITQREPDGSLVQTGRRKEYVVVNYIDPLETNRPALGYDIASNPVRQTAIQKAFSAGKTIATGRITLVQETGNQFGVLILMPVYHSGAMPSTEAERHKRRKGLAVEVLRIGDVVETALQRHDDTSIALYLYDLSAQNDKSFLYTRAAPQGMTTEPMFADLAAAHDLHWKDEFEFAGRRWCVLLTTTPAYLNATRSWQAIGILIGALILTLVTAFYFVRKLQHTVEIEQKVDQQRLTNKQLAREIAIRKESESTLQRQKDRVQNYLDVASVLIIAIDADQTVSLINRKGTEVLGYTEAEIIGQNWFDHFVPPKDRERTRAAFKQLVAGKIDYAKYFENKVVTKSGQQRLIAWHNSLLTDDRGNVSATLSSGEDITERRIAEQALRESEERYRNLFEMESDPIFLIEKKTGRILEANHAATELYGFSHDELMALRNTDLSAEPEKTAHATHSPKTTIPIRYHKKKDGTVFPVEITARHFSWQGRGVHVAAIRDITFRLQSEAEREKLQEELLQARKMEAIGTLAGGIAHDFNNLLMGILGRVSMINMTIDDADPVREHLEGIDFCVKSATDLTKQLLGIARGGTYEVIPSDLNELVRDNLTIFGRTRKQIQIRYELEPGLWTAEVDRAQFSQVLLNLFVNAWQAMPGGGLLRVTTSNVEIGEQSGTPTQLASGKYVEISISDTGVGMDKAIQQKIFDPFFTTKETGRGAGLGLASAYGIIKNHNGRITVSSIKGRGSTFRIYLPVSEKTVALQVKQKQQPLTGSGTILLVDDEPFVLDVGKELLEKIGYRVYTADSGEAALKQFNDHGAEIELVLLDMIMPGLSGGEIFDRLKALRPGLKVILCSGYSIDGQAREILDRGCDGFIQKPYELSRLSRKIKTVLESQPTP